MKTWAVVTQKGGAGKTTIALHLAIVAQARGLKTTLIDVDPQNSAMKWAGIRQSDSPAVEPVIVPDLLQRLRHLEGLQRDLVIIDTSPRADRDAMEVARLADLIIVPVQPSILDLPSVKDTMRLIDMAGKRERAVIVINRHVVRTGEADEAVPILQTMGRLLPERLGDRVDFRRALTGGKGVTEFSPSSQAAKEVTALYDALAVI